MVTLAIWGVSPEAILRLLLLYTQAKVSLDLVTGKKEMREYHVRALACDSPGEQYRLHINRGGYRP